MKFADREWALKVAFLLFYIFFMLMLAFMENYASPEKARQVVLLNSFGVLAGVLLLPLLLPLGTLRKGLPLSKFKTRLVIIGILFLPGIVVRFLGYEVWQASIAASGIITVGNGLVTALFFGLFISLAKHNRVFWSCLSVSSGFFAYYTANGLAVRYPGKNLESVLFLLPGIFLIIGGIFLIWFLLNMKNEEEKSEVLHPSIFIPRFSFVYPLLAVFVVTFANSFTNQLFHPILKIPFGSGLHLPAVALILFMSFWGVFADRSGRRFLEITVILCSVIFLLSPSLLLFGKGEILFFIINTLNAVVSYIIFVFLPFVIVDLYWQSNGTKNNGYWAWLLAIAVYLMRSNSKIQAGLFKNITLDNVYAVILLSLTGVVFYLLCRKSLNYLPGAKLPVTMDNLVSLEDIFKERGLSVRETEVAALLVKEGLSNEEIAKRLFVSPETIKSHVKQIYRKFDVKNRASFMVKVFNK